MSAMLLEKDCLQDTFGPRPPYPNTWGTASSPLKQTVRARWLALACDDDDPALASNRCARSSRICPANDRETSRNDGNGWGIECAGQEPDWAISAGSEIGPENTLKVETRGRTPLGLQAQTPGLGTSSKSSSSLNRDSYAEYPENVPSNRACRS
jgi:hypothetical protein